MKTRTRVATLAMLAVALSPAAAAAQDGGVIDKNNADPNEVYNLPENFDDNYKPKKTPRRVKVTIDFRDAPLNDVVKFFSSVLQRNFIISNSIQANKTITIISPKPVSQGEAYRAFLEALNMNGLTIIKAGSFYKIVDAKTAGKEPGPIYAPGKKMPAGSQVVTSIIEVENTPVEDIQKVVQSFVTANATIVTYDNLLILTDTATNIRRIQRLVKRLDQDGKSGNVYVYKVAHAEAGEVQQKLSEIFEIAQGGANNANNRNPRNSKVSAEGGGGDELDVTVSQIIADERTNQLIIVSDERSFRKISQMLELLDVPTEVGGQIHVKFLEYADAEELSGTLSTLASGSGQRNTGRNTARRGTVNSAAAASNPQAAQLLSGEVQVTAHTPTNSLIIVASPRDYMSLERVVNLLDRPRRQVWVEAVIMEISLGQQNDTSIGFNGGLGQDFDGLVPQSAVDDGLVSSTTGLVLGQSNFGDGFTSVLGAPGGALGLLGPSLTIPGIELTIPAFAMFLQATQTDSNINVLSTPSLLALDNEESEIVVGDRVPFPQGAVGQGGVAGLAGLLGGQGGQVPGGLGGLGLLGGGLLNQVTYEDVGITLRIKPQVNESKYVRLEVDQEVSSVGAPTDFGPTRSKRSIKTIVLVKDQSTVVIGGLIRDDENDSETKVPFLGDIPLLGLLFRTTNTTKTKQNLVLMLTPYIIESEADLNKIRERKRKERQELLRLFQRRDAEYMSRVDYGKKSGVIDRMRRNISDAKLQEEARRKALEAFEQTGPRYQILGTTPAPAPGKNGGEEKPGAVPVTDGGE